LKFDSLSFLVEDAVPVPFKELWIDVILARRDKCSVLDGQEILGVVVFADVSF